MFLKSDELNFFFLLTIVLQPIKSFTQSRRFFKPKKRKVNHYEHRLRAETCEVALLLNGPQKRIKTNLTFFYEKIHNSALHQRLGTTTLYTLL